MSTIGGLLMPTFKPYDLGGTLEQANRIAGGQTANQTALITLADLKAKQASEQEYLLAIKNNPEIAKLLLGGSTIASLPTTGGPPPAPGPGPGPITQSPLGGGPAQQIPASPDLSRFANVPPTGGGPIPPNVMGQTMPTVTPPQSVLGSLGPAGGMPGPGPQGAMQGPQNPLLEMARRDPRAAMMLQQQIEQRQELGMKRQEQHLKLGAATLGYVGQQAQGVTDQASLDALRSDLQSQGLGKYAAQLPQLYSKEAMQPFIAKALDVKDSLTLQVADLQAQAAVIKARKEGRSVDVDNQLRAMGVQPGQETPEQIKAALQAVQEGKIAVSSAHGQGQLRETQLGVARIGKDNQVEYVRGPTGEILQPKATQAEQTTATFANLARKGHESAVALEQKGFQPGFWEKVADKLPLDMGNYLTSEDYQKYKDYVTDFAQAWLRETSKGAITPDEWTLVYKRYFPQPGNSQAQIEAKSQARQQVIKELEDVGKGTGRTGTQAAPTSQGSAKPVSQMNAEETRAEIAAIKARGGK